MVVGEKRGKERGLDYVAHLSVRVPGGFVTVVVRRSGAWLVARVGVVGRIPDVSKFGPWPAWVEAIRAVLSLPGIVQVEGDTYVIRRLLTEAGYWFNKKNKVYCRSPLELEIREEGEPADYYAEMGF